MFGSGRTGIGSPAGRLGGPGAPSAGATFGSPSAARFGPSSGYGAAPRVGGVSAVAGHMATAGASRFTAAGASPFRPGMPSSGAGAMPSLPSFRSGVTGMAGKAALAAPGSSAAAAGSAAAGGAGASAAGAGGAASAASAGGAAAGGKGGRAGGERGEREKLKFVLRDILMLKTVGTGTFGRVRVVQYKPTKQHYAMKILKKSEIVRLKQVDHIKNEVRILSAISHPFIVNLLGHMQDERRIYLLLEYVQGGELFSYLRRESRFGNEQASFYASQIALAFDYLHSMSVVYRDLKPENLLMTAAGNIKLVDFGFAKKVEDRTWTLCGTPEYLAPEIIQSKGHNKCVDWWALGILIFEMLAGYPPFYDESPFGIYQKILAGKLEFPKHFAPEARDLIRKLLTADKTKRLGCLRGGVTDIKEHPWFAKLDWEKVLACRVPAPHVPRVRDEKDTSNFDEYPDSDSESGRDTTPRLPPKEAELFAEFDTF